MNSAGGNNMSLGGPSQVLHVRENSQNDFDELFSVLNNTPSAVNTVPMKHRNLPDSFFKPPSVPRPGGNHSRESSADSSPLYTVVPRGSNPALQISHGRSRSSPAGLLQTLSAAPPVPSHLKTQSFDIAEAADNRPLPPGWEIAATPRGERYFLNHNDQTTSWEDPRKTVSSTNINTQQPPPHGATPPQLPAAVTQALSSASGPLPGGWEQASTPEGEIYFINHNDKSTSWYDPRLPKQMQKIAIRPCPGPALPSPLASPPQLPQSATLPGGGTLHRLPNQSEAQFQSQLQRLQQEKQRLLKRQQEISRQEHELQNLMTSRVSSPPSTAPTSTEMATVTSGVDPFLGQGTATEFHARQNSADSGLGGMGTSYSLPRTPEDFLGNVDEMETQETGHKVTNLPSSEFGLDSMQAASSMDVGTLGDPTGADSQGPTGMDSDDLVPSLQEDISNELLNDIDGQKMENLLTWL